MATIRMAKAATELYEGIHDDDGAPMTDYPSVERAIADFKKQINLEVDFIKQAVIELQEEGVR